MSFRSTFEQYSWDEIASQIQDQTSFEVEQSLSKPPDMQGLMALLSPAAAPYLEELAHRSKALTQKRFGRCIQMYIPLYLSNKCQNICTYCGFSMDNKIPRRTLIDSEIEGEARIIKKMGFDHVLLVSGEANRTVGIDYFENAIRLLSDTFSHISLEVQPLDEDEYRRLRRSGLNTVLVYQETYHEATYKKHHPKGKKSNFNYRLDTPDRLGKSGMHKIGLGTLIGLEDWRTDAWFCGLHLDYLKRKYWKTKFSMSFPRLRPAVGCDDPEMMISDAELVQLICAYRLFDENLELSLSTRESPEFRDEIIQLGITSMSAGSRTDPGGYANTQETLEQFEIDDDRSPAEVADMVRSRGYEPVWKDWDKVLA